MKRNIRYVKRITIPLTRECTNDCLYCGFKKKDSPLVTLEQVQAILELAQKQNCSEIRLMAGAAPHHFQHIQKELSKKHINSIAQYAFVLSQMILNYGFLPSVDLGLLSAQELEFLGNVSASIYLLLECKKDERFKSFTLQEQYLQMINHAGTLKIPFTAGIIVGLGESIEDRFDTIAKIAASHKKHHHIQEFVLQGYVLNENTKLPLQNFLSLNELVEIYKFILKNLKGVSVQVQPNTLDFWQDLISLGADSIGGISEEIDYVVPRYNEDELIDIEKRLKKLKCRLQKQLPLTVSTYKNKLYSKKIETVLHDWTNRKEYQFYNN